MTNNFDLNKFNSFLDKASKTIACDTECQRLKTASELKYKYTEAKNNRVLAEPQYQIAKRNYYTYVAGQNGYNDILDKELNHEAKIMIETFNKLTDEEISKIKSQLQTYDGLLLNFRNVVDLYKKYKIENMKLFKELKNDTNDILTNDRKTFYEDQRNESLNDYYQYILLIIYIIVVICFIVFSLIYPSGFSYKFRIILILIFIALPFIATWILGKIIYAIYWFYDLLPKNVYR
jgi:hypothetical protein